MDCLKRTAASVCCFTRVMIKPISAIAYCRWIVALSVRSLQRTGSVSFGSIEQQLKGPDGARLMNRPIKYKGGIQHFFREPKQYILWPGDWPYVCARTYPLCRISGTYGQGRCFCESPSPGKPCSIQGYRELRGYPARQIVTTAVLMLHLKPVWSWWAIRWNKNRKNYS